jgi:ATP-dependent DNA ligase
MEHEARDWRPQAFGRTHARDVHDAIVEPGWDGARVLVHIRPGAPISVIDIDGEDQAEIAGEICAALEQAFTAESAILDGYLTYQATARMRPTIPGQDDAESVPAHFGRFMLGSAADLFTGERDATAGQRRGGAVHAAPPDAREESVDEGDLVTGPLAFVAVDLLEVDGRSLLDIPLLERKRILDSAIEENLLIRKTPFLREPINSFLLTWRTAGFEELAYKDQNSRYRPGEKNAGWALAPMPRR